MYQRKRECLSCKHEWYAPVVMSEHTLNLSGEARIWCPECNSAAIMSGPQEVVRPKCYEPIRPLSAPWGGRHYAAPMIFGGWRVYYGEPEWPSASYWLVPNVETEHGE